MHFLQLFLHLRCHEIYIHYISPQPEVIIKQLHHRSHRLWASPMHSKFCHTERPAFILKRANSTPIILMKGMARAPETILFILSSGQILRLWNSMEKSTIGSFTATSFRIESAEIAFFFLIEISLGKASIKIRIAHIKRRGSLLFHRPIR